MDASEVGDTVADAAHREEHEEGAANNFRKRTAVFVGVMGMLLAIASLGGEASMKDTINANIRASDTYSFYQAKYLRQTSYQIAVDALQNQLLLEPTLPAEARDHITKQIEDYRAMIASYESDAAKGNGKKELLERAKDNEHERDLAQRKDLNFDYSRALYEIAIVLGSVAIVAASPALVWLCGGLALVATILSMNGFFLLFDLPFR